VSLFSPLVTRGFGPGVNAIVTQGYNSSLESIAAALAKWGQGTLAPIATSGGSSSSKYERSDRSNNFTIRIGIVQCNEKVWHEDKKVNYITQDEGTIIKMSLSDVTIIPENILIKASVRSLRG